MIIVFIIGYIMIATEHKLQIDKAAVALLTAGFLWIIYILFAPLSAPVINPVHFQDFVNHTGNISSLPLLEQCRKFIVDVQIVESLGEISETLFFLIGAMTIVEIIDVHGGFHIITSKITTKEKRKLLWVISGITFFMSAVLDNMTTAIVMVMLLRRIITNYKERWVFASMIIIAANSGGAWSPIGDVTTIMLWVKGKVTALPLITKLFLPSLVSTIVPLLFATRMLKGEITPSAKLDNKGHMHSDVLSNNERLILLLLGIACLLYVPLFKYITHLPPFVGVLIGLGVLWVYTELLYRKKREMNEDMKHRVTRVIRRIDTPTILFFLGILMSVGALQATGVLNTMGQFLNDKIHNVYIINVVIGALSSVVDNVPLVAVAMGMYPLVEPANLATIADPAFMQHFVQDGDFWLFLAYCSGVGGSMLIIGSVSGVVVMGIEKMSFSWYLKNISLLAAAGYIAGAVVYILAAHI